MRSMLGLLIAVLLLAVAPAAMAQDLDLTLDPIETSVTTGDTAVFLGLLENALGYSAEFTGMDVSLPGFDPADISILFSFDDLADDANRTESMFSAYVAPSVATGSYFGTMYLDYDYNGGAGSGTLERNSRINVGNTVPEPALIQLPALLGLGGFALWRRRHRGLGAGGR
ncbi:MAG: hypothetical protein FJX72_13945 [Armatimonadetes bacterium]|nr:hypothetical protein [Armatimonadota bacterium]